MPSKRRSSSSLDALGAAYRDPQLATLLKDVPDGGAWIYELKFDGYRILALKSGSRVRLMSRRHQDWTGNFAAIARDVAKLSGESSVLDGEVCALDAKGAPSFQLLQNRGDSSTRLAYFVFDLLFEDGADLRMHPIEARRERLAALIAASGHNGAVVLSSAVMGDPAHVLEAACKAGMEGIVAKQRGSPYVGGRTKTWVKIKCDHRQEFAVVGWLPLLKSRPLVGSLALGLMQPDGRFHFAGKVGTGFNQKTRKTLFDLLSPDESTTPMAVEVPRFGGLVRFVKPRHVAEVRFSEWTAGGHVRHPSFQGLRTDKRPEDCVREEPSSPPPAGRSSVERAPASSTSVRPVVAGVGISHPDRVLDPTGVTKVDLARYYEAIGPRMLPFVQGRPLSLLRWAEGKTSDKGGVFLRHARAWGPSELRRVSIREKTKTGEYLVIETVAGLVALAQMDILEIHTWNSVIDDLERPDRLVFDLDPAPGVPWARVIEAASEVRDQLRRVGLESWPKTTGGKGLHVVVPLVPAAGWDDCFAFARALAQRLATEKPKRYVATMSKSARDGRIFIDYLRNLRTSTSVAAYSIRARPGAPVSIPVGWDELSAAKTAQGTKAALGRAGDRGAQAWADYWNAKQSLPK